MRRFLQPNRPNRPRAIATALGALAMAAALVPAARAEIAHVGVGAIVGDPTGVHAKLKLVAGTALDLSAAWTLRGNNELQLQGDYVYHRYDVFVPRTGRAPIYFGIGGRVRFVEVGDNLVGVRFPVGVAYEFDNAPFDVFGEIVPILDVAPDTDFDLEGAIGGRFWF